MNDISAIKLWIAVLDPTACVGGGTASQWVSFTWLLFDAATNPAFVLPILFSLILLPWLVRSLRWKRQIKRQISGFGLILLLLYGLICAPISINLGNQFLLGLLPRDSGSAADAIVVLGRGPDLRPERTQTATALWKAGRAPLVFATGRGDAHPIARALTQSGLPQLAIDGEPCSRTTEENALFTAAQLQPQGVKQILLVTDPPHMLRSFLTFRSLGFEVTPVPNPLPAQLPSRKQAFLLVREYLGLVSYGALGRFSPRVVPAEIAAQVAVEAGN